MNWQQKSGALLAMMLGSLSLCQATNSPDACHTLRKHGQQAEAKSCYESLVRTNSPYLQAEGYWGLEQYDQANEQFRIATAQPDSNPLYKVRWGLLLHQRFNNTDAVGLFQEALKKDPKNAQAYLGLAIVSADGFDGKATDYISRALVLDPKLVEAHEFAANLALEDADTEHAIAEADEALRLSPDALNAMAIHAAIELLADRSPDPWLDKIRKVNPGYAEGYAHVAHYLELNYRFEDAIGYYRKAIEADPQYWPARSQLGVGLMRLGQEDEPFKQLEMCYNNGYRDAETVNSLRLLDSYKNFVTYKENGTILRLNKSEAELLHPYFEAELQRIIATYNKKYQMKLTGPVQVEVYPNHEDFAVRTMGMPGLGALGVTFGQVVAMDSPSARKPGDFNWGSTLWHEMSHVYILTATNRRVPRWFTEGLAVHEETQVSPEWGDRVSPEILTAIRDKKLLPVAKLDRGFIFPEYPAQVVVSYFEAGSICDYIKSHWNEGKLLDMVHSYAQRKTTPEVIQSDLGVSPEEFDKQYLQWVNQRYGAMAASFDEWRKAMEHLAEAANQKQYDTVLRQGEAVRSMYPEYIGDANVYQFLASANLAQGDKKPAAEVLTHYEKMGGEDPSILKKLASLEEELGQPKDAAATLDRINYIYPVHDEDLHRHLGDLWFAQANYPGAIREYTAVVALN
ncbi:MAG TPA: tetratricopeptide repeat protein, partial [Acidobacteriaceae bacterium]|nr:tetratricopeptide repeat protein [Acidobacteriaceae bacterium]